MELAADTSEFARARPLGFFRGARNIAKLAGEMVTPDYYTRKLGEFGLRDRSSQVDEFGMDSVYRSSIRPVMEFLFRRWWRVKLDGISNIPDRGPALLVGNHAGLVPYDAAMVAFGVENRHPAKRRVRFLIEDWVAPLPFANPLVARAGAVRAHRENAERLLRTGHLVGAFPEGTKGSLKYYRDRYRVQRFGRGGSVRLATKMGVPIVPFAILGSEEIYPVVAKANWLAKIIGLEELPISINAFLGPLGVIPLPSKWIIRFGKPIEMKKHGEKAARDDIRVNALTNQLRMTVQKMVDDLLERRKRVWLG
jgi:1-acyl-sn-glycerol-3-phosphate acyltransferase